MTTFTLLFQAPSAPWSPEQSLAAWGLARPRRRLVSQAAGTLLLAADGANADAPALFPYGATVIVNKTEDSGSSSAKTQWFYGVVTKTPARGSGRVESRDYEISDPWWFLENLVYQQQWVPPSYPGATPVNDPYRSHCFLNKWIAHPQTGGGLYFTRQPTDAQIEDAIAFAQTFNPVPLQLASPLPSMDIPLEEVRDLTCAEVIRKQLRWMPDAVTYFDHSTTPPTLHITRRANLTPVSLPFPISPPSTKRHPLTTFNVNPRYDLFHPSVAIIFEQINQVAVAGNNQQWLLATPQVYPPTATGKELQALVLTVSLEGLNDKVTAAAIHVGAVQTSSSIDPSTDDWWLAKQPWLRRCNRAAISSLVFETAAGFGLPVDAGGNPYSNELLSGQIAPWMPYAAAECLVVAEIEYVTRQPSAGDPASGPFSGLPQNTAKRTVSVRVQMTSAPTGRQTLYSLSNALSAETIPANLARTLYLAVGFVPYEGSVTLVEQECSGSVTVGNTLNLAGSAQEAWALMNATVQQVEENLETGTTRITFGPPCHLGAPDLVELLRLNRFRIVYASPAAQIETAQVSAQTQLGEQTALENSSGGGDAHSQFGVAGYYDTAQPANLAGGIKDCYIPLPPATTPVTPSDPAQGTARARGASLLLFGAGAAPPATGSPATTDPNATVLLAIADLKGSDGNYHAIAFREAAICVSGVQKRIMLPCSLPY